MDKERLAKTLEKGFTASEAEQLMNFTKIIAGKAVKDFLTKMMLGAAPANLKEKSDRADLYRKIMAKIKRIETGKDNRNVDFSGFQENTFTDSNGVDHRVRIQLSIVPREHELTIDMPKSDKQQEIAKSIFSSMDKFCDMAAHYYDIVLKKDDLVLDLSQYFEGFDVARLLRDDNTRSLFFDPEAENRLGILVFFVDSKGQPIN